MVIEIWVGIIGTIVLLAFIINGFRLARGPEGHGANAGRLHAIVGIITLPFVWMAVVAASMM